MYNWRDEGWRGDDDVLKGREGGRRNSKDGTVNEVLQ